MRVGTWNQLTAVLNFCILIGLKRNQTPQSLFRDFCADKTFTTGWSGARVQVWVQVQAPAGHLAVTPKGCSRRQ